MPTQPLVQWLFLFCMFNFINYYTFFPYRLGYFSSSFNSVALFILGPITVWFMIWGLPIIEYRAMIFRSLLVRWLAFCGSHLQLYHISFFNL